jgi:tetratricopeptide (TPR) repeat protein
MNTINKSKEFENIIDDFKKQNLDSALSKLKKFSWHHSNDLFVDRLFASIYFKKKDWVNAIVYYRKILPGEKEKSKIYNNIGVAFFELGKISDSIKVFKKSLNQDSNLDLTYCNLGISYDEIGKYEKAINSYLKALEINKNNSIAAKNLINVFNVHKPTNTSKHPLLNINSRINKIFSIYKINNVYREENIKKILVECDNILKNLNLNLYFTETQIFRRNSQNLNCNRHFKVFNKFNIIPKYCFGCYKVQINLENVVDLIKLFFIFDNLKLKNNNIRKCIVEIRDKINGNYKGYIYCNSLKEAKEILEEVNQIINKVDFKNINISIKHGCSEFYKPFPKYEKINLIGEQEISYDEKWKKKELIIDNYYPERIEVDKKIWSKSLNGLNLSDVLIIKNWLNYADTIGDYSYKKIDQQVTKPNFMNKILKPQLAFRKKI